jgi:hypothetical protein
MKDKKIIEVIVILVLTAVWSGCGRGSSASSSSQMAAQAGSVGFVTGAAANGVLAFRADITRGALVDSAGHSVSVAGLPRHLEVRHLELAPGILFQASPPPATYISLNLTLANVEMDAVNADGGVQTFTASTSPALIASQLNVTVRLNMSLPQNSAPGLMIDFDLADSITNDASGNYVFRPVVNATQVADTDPGWELGAARGKIVAILKDPASISDYPASIDLQLFDGGFTVELALDSTTHFSPDLQGISGLKVGQAVETYAHFRSGTYTAGFIDSASDPTVSKQGIVVGTPSVDGAALLMLVRN